MNIAPGSQLRRLWRGEIKLWKTFWFFGVAVLCLLSLAFIASQGFIATALGKASKRLIYVDCFLTLIFLVYGIFIVVAVWKVAKKDQGPRIWSILARATIILTMLWFGGNLALYLMLRSVIPPEIEPLVELTPEKLTIVESAGIANPFPDADKVNFKGISIRFPFYKEDISKVTPIFIEHQLREIMIKLGNGGYFLFYGEPTIHFSQTKKSFIQNIMSKLFMDQQMNRADTIDTMQRIIQYSRLKDFSWWNVFNNTGLSTKLTLKVIAISAFGSNQRIYDVETPYIKGFLRQGEIKADKLYLDFSFEWQDAHYAISCINFEKNALDKLIRILSTVRPIVDADRSSHETESIYKKKELRYPEELLLLSTMSRRGLSKDRLERLLRIMEQNNYDSDITGWVKEEIGFLSK